MIRKAVPIVALLLSAACSDGPTAVAVPAAPDVSASRGQSEFEHHVLAGLAEIRRVTARYHDPSAAMAAGYTVWSPDPFAQGATCPGSPTGKMGYHLVNVSLRGSAAHPAAGDAIIDLLHPEMLLYSKRADGTMQLVGVEYLVFKAAWEREHGVGAAPPEILGHKLVLSSHTFVAGGPSIEHYELHVWVWSHNPNGTFDPWNPNVTC